MGLYVLGGTVPAPTCEVCGKTGAASKACTFGRACSCWRGIPCDREPVIVRIIRRGALPAKDMTAY